MPVKPINKDFVEGLAQLKQRKALKEAIRAKKLHVSGALAAARKSYEMAAKVAPLDMKVVAIVADGLSELGCRDQAIDILQNALAHSPADETVLTIIGKIAQKMSLPDIAEKVFSIAVDLNPSETAHYVNLAESYRLQEKYDQAVALVKDTLEVFPGVAALWNIMGTLMVNQSNAALAKIFYDEAYRLDPNDDKILLNLANLQFDQGDPCELYKKAISINEDNHHAHVGLATYYLRQGDLSKGWAHYEHRKKVEDGQGASVKFTFDLPEWTGQSLRGKSILILAEQGLGDEVFYSLSFQRLYQEAKKLYIGCDPRLVSIFQRSFPDAKVVEYEDKKLEGRQYRSFPSLNRKLASIDFGVWAGSVPRVLWHKTEDIPVFPEGILRADPQLVQGMEAIVPRTERKKVGLSWRSGNLSFERSQFYIGLEGARLLMRFANVDYYCLQYGWKQEEIDWLNEHSDNEIRVFPDMDLKNDLEANLALMAHMDLVIGPATATQQLSLCSGIPTWVITGGAPWWSFGQKSIGPSFAPKSFWSWGETGEGQLELCRKLWEHMNSYIQMKGIEKHGITARQFMKHYNWVNRSS